MERKLASIRTISSIKPIIGADAIECAQVDGWEVVVKKGEYQIGDFVVYCEIDSFLPIKEQYEFLRKSSYKKLIDGTEGFRLRTVKLRGQISQGLLLPLTVLGSKSFVSEGEDVTELLNITKWEPIEGAVLSGDAKGLFSEKVPKTNEERIQNLAKYEEKLKAHNYVVTEKVDGCSFTIVKEFDTIKVCSRNYEVKSDDSNIWGKIAQQYNLIELLSSREDFLAIQGEIVGPGIQDNIYKLLKHKLLIFNIYDTRSMAYWTKRQVFDFCLENGLEMVPVIDWNWQFESVKQTLEFCQLKSKLTPTTNAEGVVCCSDGMSRVSFKAISNLYLLNND